MTTNELMDLASFQAGQDLSAHKHHFVSMSADGQVDPTGNGAKALGVLHQESAVVGSAVSVAIRGISKVVVGTGGLTAGNNVASDANAEAVLATTGEIILGTALETAAAGELARILLHVPSETSA